MASNQTKPPDGPGARVELTMETGETVTGVIAAADEERIELTDGRSFLCCEIEREVLAIISEHPPAEEAVRR